MTKYFQNEKVVVAFLQKKGSTYAVDSTSVTVLDMDSSGNVLAARGTTVPAGESGYAVGAQFVDTNKSGHNLYVNNGDATTASWELIGSIDSGDIEAGAVDSAAIATDAVGSDEIATDAVDSDEIAADAVDESEIATDAVRSDEVQDGSLEEVDVSLGLKTDLMTMALPGTAAENSFPFNAETETEQAAALAVVDDGGVQALLSASGAEAGYTANYQLFPDTEAEDDAAYFGAASPFGVLLFDIDTVATYGADSLAWEYWNGSAWTALTIVWDTTDTTANDGLRSFQQDGYVLFSAPTDWASTTVNGQAGYFVRARVIATANITQIPTTNSVEHKIITDAKASEVPVKGNLSRAKLSFFTVSGANNDTKIILCNLSSGACSAIKTLTKAIANNEVADFDLEVAAGDALAIFVTAEDGTTEFADGIMEAKIVKS